jgi:hypothetical protein
MTSSAMKRPIDQHAAGAEDERLDDQRGDAAGAARRFEGIQRRFLAAGGRKGQPRDVEQQGIVGRVEDAAFAHRHSADGVAVIGALERKYAGALFGAMTPEAERHFQRDLHRGRSAIREKYVFEPRRRQRHQAPRELLRGLVREAGENHLIEAVGLVLDRLHDVRMTMAVGHDPPGRDGIEDAPAIGGFQPCSGAFRDQRRIRLYRMLRERMPDRGRRRHAASCRKSSIRKCRAKVARSDGPVRGSRYGRRPR